MWAWLPFHTNEYFISIKTCNEISCVLTDVSNSLCLYYAFHTPSIFIKCLFLHSTKHWICPCVIVPVQSSGYICHWCNESASTTVNVSNKDRQLSLITTNVGMFTLSSYLYWWHVIDRLSDVAFSVSMCGHGFLVAVMLVLLSCPCPLYFYHLIAFLTRVWFYNMTSRITQLRSASLQHNYIY